MRGKDEQQLAVFSYVNPEQRVPQDRRFKRRKPGVAVCSQARK